MTENSLATAVIALTLRRFLEHPECRTDSELQILSRQLDLRLGALADLYTIGAKFSGRGDLLGRGMRGMDDKRVYPEASLQIQTLQVRGSHRTFFQPPDYMIYVIPAVEGPESMLALAEAFPFDRSLVQALQAYIDADQTVRRRLYEQHVMPHK